MIEQLLSKVRFGRETTLKWNPGKSGEFRAGCIWDSPPDHRMHTAWAAPPGRPFSSGCGVATNPKPLEDQEDLREANHRLRKALQECRDLLARTQELLERTQQLGGAD